ncbi:MAG: BTAD domain-containing putative transcriptional regulator [Gemmatimonadales bacterium]
MSFLILLAASGEIGVSRDKLAGYLWPESDDKRARHRLSVTLHVLRKELGEEAVLASGEMLRLNPEAVWTDVRALEEALERDQPGAAVEVYGGPFLDGVHLEGAREFERWVEGERVRCAGLHARALETLALQAEDAGEYGAAVGWWKRLAAQDPYDSRVALRLMEALAAAGDVANALQHARAHELLLREELEVEPAAEVLEAAERLRLAGAGRIGRELPPGVRVPAAPAVPPRRALVVGASVAMAVAALALVAGWLIFGERGPPSNTLAVLPFENLSGDPANDYFSDGIHDQILTQLYKIGGLSVRGRVSVMQYRDSPMTAREIGEELQADYLLEGGVMRVDGTVRINVQLIDSWSSEHVWAETYDRDLTVENLLDVMSEVTLRVAQELRAALTADETARIAARPTENLQAYEFFLRGEHYLERSFRRRQDREFAVEMFERAIELDPGFAEAYAELALALDYLIYDHGQYEEAERIRDAVEEALRLGPNTAAAHLAAVEYHLVVTGDLDALRSHIARAGELEPGNAVIAAWAGLAEWYYGDAERARVHFLSATRQDPHYFGARINLAAVALVLRRFVEADTLLRELANRRPDHIWVTFLRSMLELSRTGNTPAAGAFYLDLPAVDEAVTWHLPNWDWDDRMLFRLFPDYFDGELERRTLDDPSDSAAYYLAKADAAVRRESPGAAAAYYDSARVTLLDRIAAGREHAKVRGGPPRLLAAEIGRLGIAYVGLGELENARQQAREALGLLEREQGFNLAFNLPTVAEIFTLTGDYDAAIDQLDRLLSMPSHVTVPLLEVDPLWDPLRDHPRFKALLEKHE